MENYCPHCGEVHKADLSPKLCEQRRQGSMAVYGRVLTREEAFAATAESVVEKTGETPAERYLAQEARKHASGRRDRGHAVKPKPSVPGADLEVRLAATEKRLAEIREKQRARTAKWRSGRKSRKPV